MTNKKKILFLSTGNSYRSQMAEGWCKQLHGNKYDAYSAGTKKNESIVDEHSINDVANKIKNLLAC